jgi:hypothetical protein
MHVSKHFLWVALAADTLGDTETYRGLLLSHARLCGDHGGMQEGFRRLRFVRRILGDGFLQASFR